MRRIGPRVALAPDVLERKVRRVEHHRPVDAGKHRFDLIRRHAAGVRAADEAAHAGARQNVDWDAVLLEPAEHADVRDAARAAAAKGHAHAWPWRRIRRLRVRSGRQKQPENRRNSEDVAAKGSRNSPWPCKSLTSAD